MISDPDRWAPTYAEQGADSVTFHVEAAAAPVRLARELRSRGARAGMALKPATPIEPYADLLPELDLVLIMTVEPGFGGTEVPRPVPAQDRAHPEPAGPQPGATSGCRSTAACRWRRSNAVPRPGPTRSWPGSAVFGADDPDAMVNRLRQLAAGAQ